jgi:hypothetical protein
VGSNLTRVHSVHPQPMQHRTDNRYWPGCRTSDDDDAAPTGFSGIAVAERVMVHSVALLDPTTIASN